MNQSSIGSEGSQNYSFNIDPSLFLPATSGTVTPVFNTTISQSDQEIALSPLYASSPRLPLPSTDPKDYVLLVKAVFGAMAVEAGEAWAKNIAAIDAEIKAEINSPKYQALREEARKRAENAPGAHYQSEVTIADRIGLLLALSVMVSGSIQPAQVGKGAGGTNAIAETTVDGTIGIDPTQHTGTVGAARKGAEEGNAIAQLVAQGFVASVGELAFFQMMMANPVIAKAANSAIHPESTVVQGVSNAIFPKGGTGNTTAQVGAWFAGLLFVGSAYQLAVERAPKPVNGEQVTHDVNFAKTNAERILGKVNSPQFTSFLESAISVQGNATVA